MHGANQTESQAATIAALEAENARLREIVDYVLQDEMHNRLTPRVVDIAYSAFMRAKEANDEDGGPTDWFTDTKPMVMQAVDRIRQDTLDKGGSG